MVDEKVDSEGIKRVFTETKLDEIVQNTRSRIERNLFSGALLVIGHPATDNQAYGWTSEIKQVGQSILPESVASGFIQLLLFTTNF